MSLSVNPFESAKARMDLENGKIIRRTQSPRVPYLLK